MQNHTEQIPDDVARNESLPQLVWRFTRPFTLMPPAIGMISGGITAFGARGGMAFSWAVVWNITLGAFVAAMLNAASNGINQIYDLDLDRVNKPNRPLPSGAMTIGQAWAVTGVLYAVAIGVSWFVGPAEAHHACFWLVVIAAIMTYLYSAPPFRTKRWGIVANLTIAIPRGVLLKVAGWSTVRDVASVEPWYIGTIFGLFLLGAATTKDYADIEGDRANGCITLPIKYGVRKSAWMIAPFFVFPFLLMPLGVRLGVLTGNGLALDIAGIGLACWGAYTAYLILRDPEELATTENHVSWTHMYLMMMATQVAFAVSYLI